MDQQVSLHQQDFNQPIQENMNEEAITFPTLCGECGGAGHNKMCTVTIPFVKKIIIMSFLCEFCGFKDAEVKGSNEITPKGKLFTLHVNSLNDLKRECFKSETASLTIPEIELELTNGSLGGVYSTVEGMIVEILDHLRDHNPYAGDDTNFYNEKMEWIFEKLEAFKDGKSPFTLIIRDLIDSSFISFIGDQLLDANLKMVEFERNDEDNDDLGIDTMQTENYEQN